MQSYDLLFAEDLKSSGSIFSSTSNTFLNPLLVRMDSPQLLDFLWRVSLFVSSFDGESGGGGSEDGEGNVDVGIGVGISWKKYGMRREDVLSPDSSLGR